MMSMGELHEHGRTTCAYGGVNAVKFLRIPTFPGKGVRPHSPSALTVGKTQQNDTTERQDRTTRWIGKRENDAENDDAETEVTDPLCQGLEKMSFLSFGEASKRHLTL